MVKSYQIAILMFGLLAIGNLSAKAISGFQGPIHFAEDKQMTLMSDGVYERYIYPYFGAYLTIVSSVNVNPDDGDTWALDLFDTALGYFPGSVALVYDRASDCLMHNWSPIICGLYVHEDDNVIRVTYMSIYFFGECIPVHEYELMTSRPESTVHDYWAFTPVRFRPQVETLILADSIRPTLQRSTGGSTTVAVYVEDDLNCRKPLSNVDVTLANFFVPRSGGHANIVEEEPITGYYTPLANHGGTVKDEQQHTILFAHPEPNEAPIEEHYKVAHKITGKTNSSGRFEARYTAGIFGGQERVTAMVSIPHLSDKDPAAVNTTEKRLDIKVPGLMEMARIGETHRFDMGISCGSFDPDARWLTEGNKARALELSRLWYDWHGEKLSYNDASLINGGVIEKISTKEGCHQTHRDGANIDVNSRANQLFSEGCGNEGGNLCRYHDLVTYARWVGLRPGYSGGIHLVGE